MFFRWISCALLLSVPLRGDPAPTAREIIDRVATQDKLLQARRQAFDYDLTVTREKLDAKHLATSTTTEHFTMNGTPPPPAGTNSSSGTPDDEAKKAAREEPFELLSIPDHFTYALQGEETVNGVPCYKIAFTAKPDAPYHSRDEKVLNAVSGHIWASQKDYSILRNDGALMHPVAVAWFFASLKEMEFSYETAPLPNGDAGPAQEQYRYLVSLPFFTLHERDTRKMSNYRLAGARAASQ